MKHGSLFSGIGGFDLAAQWMGWENVFHCEKEPFCQKVLKYYWPDAELFTDITKSDFTKYANTIDILTGGFPCQPYSVAGKRKGTEDHRHLWPEMLRAIREIQPRWVVGENVPGLISWNGGMVFNEVQTDLENSGYEVFPPLEIPACGKDAPHQRHRLWIIAYAGGSGVSIHKTGTIQNIDGNNKEQAQKSQQQGRVGATSKIRTSTYANSEGLQVRLSSGERSVQSQARTFQGCESSRAFTTGAWTEFPTQSPLCNGNDGISARVDTATISKSKWRNESIKAGGNAVVPQVVFEIFKAIKQFETIY